MHKHVDAFWQSVTSADPLFLSTQDSWSVNHTDALQNRVGQLGTHKPEGQHKQTRVTLKDTADVLQAHDWHQIAQI